MAVRPYEVELSNVAEEGLLDLTKSEQVLVVKQLEKLRRAPELGDLLGNRGGLNLTGYRKTYAARKRIRVIYDEKKRVVDVIAIGPREGFKVYTVAAAEAAKRRLRPLN